MTRDEYINNFIKKHSTASDWKVHTSPMKSDGTYVKTWVCADGAELTEVNRPVYETATADVEVKGIKVKISEQVKLMETELWNTDDSHSVKFYERW